MRINFPQDIFQITSMAAASVFMIGYVVTVQYFGRAGLSHGEVPYTLSFAAGASFCFFTSFFVWAALQLYSNPLSSPFTISSIHVFEAIVLLFLVISTQYSMFRAGFLTYIGLCFLAAFYLRRTASIDAEGIEVRYPFKLLMLMLILIKGFSYSAYPNFSRALGGAAPKPVVCVFLDDTSPVELNDGDRIFELLRTPEGIYVAVEPENHVTLRSERGALGFPRNYPFADNSRFYWITNSQLKAVDYRNDWSLPPQHKNQLASVDSATSKK